MTYNVKYVTQDLHKHTDTVQIKTSSVGDYTTETQIK